MRHLMRNIFISLALVVIALFAMMPPSENVQLGKDLRGGSSLIYQVQVDRTESPDEVIPKVIDVLKRRIDPNGLFEISIVRQGQDRIEITMPLPGESVKALRKAFEDELGKLEVASVTSAQFERLMRLPEQERADEIERIGGSNESLRQELINASEAYDEAQLYRTQLSLAEAAGAAEDILDELARKAAEAEIRYQVARDRVLAAGIRPEDVRRALELPTDVRNIKDESTGEIVEIESARARALRQIKERHPELVAQIERVEEAFENYSENRGALDDTSDLKRLVQASGELSFRITVDAESSPDAAVPHPQEQELRESLRENGPRQSRASDARWYRINKLDGWYRTKAEYDAIIENPSAFFQGRGYVVEPFGGDVYMLAYDTRGMRITNDDGRWKIARSYQTTDELGRPAIGFQMDAVGSRLLGELTGDNVNNSMAVLLDDEVYTAPNLQSRISNNGIIQGEFTPDEIDYVVRVMTAGSLQAKLGTEPISESTIAPELGQDNLDKGLFAGVVALAIVGVFMVFYYFGFGLVAVICLLANGILIIGALSLSRAALTLPGIAGIILTFGMAVDANVLIFERIREEMRKGLDLRTSVRLGYEKALSSIVDGNVTNLIVCFVLANVGTQEIKGFAITLGIGVACTMVSALLFSRVIVVLLVDKVKIRNLKMLPTVIPFVEKILEPKIDWMRFRPVFIVISATFVGLGIVMVASRGEKMLDTEFRGGTAVTMSFKQGPDGSPITMNRGAVQELVQGIGDAEPDGSSIRALRSADVIAVDPLDGGLESDTFVIKTIADDRDAIGRVITAAFEDKLDAPPPLLFKNSAQPDATVSSVVIPILKRTLGEVIGRPEIRNDVTEYQGGVAIVIENLDPPTSVEQLRDRMNLMRSKEDFVDVLGRQDEIIVTEGTSDAMESGVILVLDPGLGYLDNTEAWQAEVAQREWDLVRAALTTTTDSISVQNFSPAIAASFRQKAVVAVVLSLMLILIYIWVRFGSVRYSLAAIATLTHDVFVALGLIALAEIIYDTHITWLEDAARFALIEPFKIDLNLVAALLTIIGYSLNDTIIIMDRIRENRGKLSYVTRDVVNLSINQTISRTVITSGTTLLAVLILYVEGGAGVRAFSFTLLVGVLFGTYSSIAVASPLVWSRNKDKTPVVAGNPSVSSS